MKNVRKILLIDRSFQFRLIAKFILLNSILILLSGVIMGGLSGSEIEANLKSAHLAYSSMREMLFPIIVTTSLINILISALTIFLFVLVMSHKIAGPLYRFHQVIQEISQRNFRGISLIRKDDQLQQLSEALLKMQNVISEDATKLQGIILDLQKQLAGGNGAADLAKQLDEMKKILEQYAL